MPRDREAITAGGKICRSLWRLGAEKHPTVTASLSARCPRPGRHLAHRWEEGPETTWAHSHLALRRGTPVSLEDLNKEQLDYHNDIITTIVVICLWQPQRVRQHASHAWFWRHGLLSVTMA